MIGPENRKQVSSSGRVSDLGGQRQGDQVAGPRLDYAAPNREIIRRQMARCAARRPGPQPNEINGLAGLLAAVATVLGDSLETMSIEGPARLRWP